MDNEIDEMSVHEAILRKPELIEKGLGVKVSLETIQRHYRLSSSGEHIDFVFKDVSGITYLAEVKINTSPTDVIQQLMSHEYKKFIKLNENIDRNKIVPVVIVDSDSVSKDDEDILARLNIRLCTYSKEEVANILKEVGGGEIEISFELPDINQIKEMVGRLEKLKENFGDINFLLEGFKGDTWWDGYYDFRIFWLWKQGEYSDPHKMVYQWLCDGKIENCIWFTFLTAISDDPSIATSLFRKGWNWDKAILIISDKTIAHDFEVDVRDSGKWGIQALIAVKKRIQVIKTYLNTVDSSQYDYFTDLLKKTDSPFDGYNLVRKEFMKIHNIGSVSAGVFATYLSQWRVLPIMPSTEIRISQFVRRAIEFYELKKYPTDSDIDAIMRIAQKYSVPPIVIERALHKLSRSDMK